MLLAPLRLEPRHRRCPILTPHNRQLWHYVEPCTAWPSIATTCFSSEDAGWRRAAIGHMPFWTDDGMQLNQLGYWIHRAALENDLELRPLAAGRSS